MAGGRIPIIEQTTGVGGPGPAFVRAPQTSDAIGRSLVGLGQGMEQAAQGEQDLQNARLQVAKQQEHQDAAVWAGNTLSNAQLQWQKTLDEAKMDPERTANGAPGFTPKIVDEFDAWAKDAITKAPNDTAKRYLQQHLASLRTSLGNSALHFEAGARTDYRVSTTAQSFDAASQVVMGNPTKDNFLQTYAQQKAIADELQVDPETRRKLNDQLRDKMITGFWLGRIRQDPEAAARELKQGLPVTPLEQMKTGAGQGGQADTVDRVWSSLIGQESGGNQAAVSPKGAIGVAQIMPGTGPEAAALAGLPYDENRLKTDRAYNEALGQAYLKKQLATFGNMPQALAAYNAGPGAVQKAIQRAGEKGGDWLSYLPAETQGYVTSIMGKAGGARPVLLADASGALPAGALEPSGNSVLDATPMNIRLQMMQHADSEMNRMQAVYRSQISTVENDHVAAYMNGAPVAKPLSQADYVKAYGPLEGLQRFENYKAIAAMGGDISALKLAPPEQMAATLTKYQPDSSKPGYDLALKRYEILAKAADQVNQARQLDPMAYAQQVKIGDAKPLNLSDPAAFSAELGKRAGVADTMQSKYGAPYQLLTKAEAATLSQGFQGMTTQQKLGYLSSINSASLDPRAFRAVMQQIAPDSPVTAMAGVILSKQNPIINKGWISDETFTQQDVAARILEGEALLNPGKAAKAEDGKGKTYPMPKEQDLRDQFNSVVGKAFAGDPMGADFAYQAVKAYYAGQGAKDGDVTGVLDSGRMKKAITAVIGGVTDVNGKGEVVRPWGMDEARFKNETQAAFTKAMAAAGLTGTSMDNFGAYGLQAAGDSKYLLRSGTGYLVDRAGSPIILDLTERPLMSHLIPQPPAPEGQTNGGRGWTGTVKPAKAPHMSTASPNTR